MCYWWLPFAGVVAVLVCWRFVVIGGFGLIGHHGLISAESGARFRQFLNVAGLAGSLPIGLFYQPAVERSFPISMGLSDAAWTLPDQFLCLAVLGAGWIAWFWRSSHKKLLAAGGLWYVFSWVPALTLTVVQPSYLYLPGFALCLLLGLAVREVFRSPILLSVVAVLGACWLGLATARHYREAVPNARAVQLETDSFLEMVRAQSEVLPEGTVVVLLRSRVLRPDMIAELDAAYHDRQCKFDIFNFDLTPEELIAPAMPLDRVPMGPLRVSTEGLRDGRIRMAGREFYFVHLTGNVRLLAVPPLNGRFWMPGPSGWRDVTEPVRQDGWRQ
jgi:hypothetical protein